MWWIFRALDMETKIADTHICFHVSCKKKHGHLIRLILTLCTEKNTGLPRILSFYAATCGHIVFCSIPISKPPLNAPQTGVVGPCPRHCLGCCCPSGYGGSLFAQLGAVKVVYGRSAILKTCDLVKGQT